eukprot:gnl/MRDRNA2_/MRDRNA2_241021_c0_seq1.p2 gnl/MRDRNA2_/MRDRNA2_241021_c0~~gnl/MRDRNA2_/MRDRNA2_241021_c0_seq1.p2  ORF type:complete len:106 (+),score=16.73 gnl/MRDRNA2_/MRDRNA2_241021_c0_seq1:134-451(+)
MMIGHVFSSVDLTRTSIRMAFIRPGTFPSSITELENVKGIMVTLMELTSKPELNGAHGHIMQWSFDKGRAAVLLEDGRQLLLKASNLCVQCDIDARTGVPLPRRK